MNSSLKKKLIIGLGLGFIIYVSFAFFADLDKLVSAGKNFPWLLFPVVMLLASGNYLIRMIRWHLYLRNVGVYLSIKESAAVFLSGLAMSVTPGKFGELLKAQYIKNINGTKRRVTAPVIVAERITDLVGVLVLASFGVFQFSYGEIVFYIVLGVILVGIIMISSRKLSLWIIGRLKPLPFIGPRVPKLEEAYESMAALLKISSLLPATILSILAWGCESMGFYMVLNSFPGVSISLENALFIYAFAILVGAVTMLPGGLGATEGIMTGLLVLLMVPGAESVAATLITRLGTLWYAVALGFTAMAVFNKMLNPKNESLDDSTLEEKE